MGLLLLLRLGLGLHWSWLVGHTCEALQALWAQLSPRPLLPLLQQGGCDLWLQAEGPSNMLALQACGQLVSGGQLYHWDLLLLLLQELLWDGPQAERACHIPTPQLLRQLLRQVISSSIRVFLGLMWLAGLCEGSQRGRGLEGGQGVHMLRGRVRRA
jgi:hypothetical protein